MYTAGLILFVFGLVLVVEDDRVEGVGESGRRGVFEAWLDAKTEVDELGIGGGGVPRP